MDQVQAKAPEKKGPETELKFDDHVFAKIVGLTSAEVDGVLSLEGGMLADMADFFKRDEDVTKGVDVDVDHDDGEVTVEVDATLRYGESAPAVFDEVCKAIVKNVKQMTGLKVAEVKMTVKDMLTKEEIQAHQDKEKTDD